MRGQWETGGSVGTNAGEGNLKWRVLNRIRELNSGGGGVLWEGRERWGGFVNIKPL